MALEVPFGAYNGDALIIDKKSFEMLRKVLKKVLRSEEFRDLLPEETVQPMVDKLGELQRYTARHQAMTFFGDILKNHAELILTDEEFGRFSKIRNEITQTGRFIPRSEGDYNKEIFDLRLQMSALLETVFLSMLGGDVSIVNPDWRHVVRGS